ncbi:DICT sensory domain-containing protein [Salisediminibacterium beveridgei]|uniref:Sensor Protein n=1 Tax=Salisediminibacterium beveridgei TaxID=632773 RepID=A0A1D7QVP5_9BACI|nr:DICT sensory domain-containing protein [Salisediminibacterium beveridgei]AOM83075.1 Sensor Protein [Salisediminibacterium beveridgei]
MANLKDLSVFKTAFGEVPGDTAKLATSASNETLSASSLKYESKVPQLEYMCLMMENMVLTKKLKGIIYAGFQKHSRAKAIYDRYLAMAEYSEIYLFGEKDTTLPSHPNIHLIDLPKGSELMREWFLVIDAPSFKSMMVAYDLDGFGTHAVEEDRNFKGMKSSSPKTVKSVSEMLDSVI